MLSGFYTLGKVLPAKDDPFRNSIADHYDWLREHPETTHHVVDEYHAGVSRYNLYRYMREVGFETVQIYPTMVINGLASHQDFSEKNTTLLIPSVSAIEDIRSSMV